MRRAPKERYIAAIVTPAMPHFLHNMVDEEVNIPVEKTPPLLGISPAVGGYSVGIEGLALMRGTRPTSLTRAVRSLSCSLNR